MNLSLFDKRPPFVRFEERELGINQDASREAGRPVPRVVVMACITPAGSKDIVEKVATDWLAQIKEKALNGMFPLEWSQHFHAQYEEWLKGNELPREGTPVKTWQMVTREQSTRLVAIGYTTVEDLAEVPDTTLGQIGLDGRYLRDLARSWINEAKDKGVTARELANANVKIEELSGIVQRQAEMLQRLESRLEARDTDEPVKRGPGRPRKLLDGDAAA